MHIALYFSNQNIMKKTILIIDDDLKLNDLLKEYLSQFGFQVYSETHPEDGLRWLKQQLPDLIILDIMLPAMDGFEVCRIIRKNYNVPIIMLTAMGEITDRVVGLELGADDYLPKPFEPRELVARIQSVLRRSGDEIKTEKLQFGNLVADLDKQSVSLDNESIDLTTMEFELLSLFMRNPGKLLTRDRILANLRGLDWDIYNRSIDVLLSRLRQKLKEDSKKPNWIRTVWGSGYKFIGEESES
jgi:DNA-binding response OmpR family regulator